ncbi:MAG: hypothetical protein SVY41_03260 [Candidatus Nanohaloarchaea archaeon]|nr:hypothetical protein [Candidatus Nanohaloarchaea archaeon]
MAPDSMPPGLTGAATQGPPWLQQQDPNTLGIIAASVFITLAVLYLLYRYHFRDWQSGDQVTVQSDEEKLLAVLDSHDRKTTQPVLQKETGWSASKVSRVTDALEEKGELEKLRLGRKNIVQRPERTAGQ